MLWDGELPGDSDAHASHFEIHRLKGRLALTSGAVRAIQGVRELFEIFGPRMEAGGHDATGSSKIVLIGRHLEDFDFGRSLQAVLGVSQ